MAGPRSIPELSEITDFQDEDLIVVEQITGETSSTGKAKISTLKSKILSGPHNNDSEAESNGVKVGQMYYNASGEVRVRLI